jgi:hypothetical protein
METINSAVRRREPWNKGKLVGQKAPFKLKEIWGIRIYSQVARRTNFLVRKSLPRYKKMIITQ